MTPKFESLPMKVQEIIYDSIALAWFTQSDHLPSTRKFIAERLILQVESLWPNEFGGKEAP